MLILDLFIIIFFSICNLARNNLAVFDGVVEFSFMRSKMEPDFYEQKPCREVAKLWKK